jgi:hypothetical protein
MLHIGNKYHPRPPGIVIYAGRPSPLGNPFVINKDGTRDEVCDKYEAYFKEAINNVPQLKVEVDRIIELIRNGNDVTLTCFCVPARCHLLTVQAYINSQLQ